MNFLYGFGLHLYYLLILIGSLIDKKAKLWINGRKKIFKRIKNDINGNEHIAWFHSASLGEFEQGRPVIEEFKLQYPNFKILVTFFSPSGYEIRKNYKNADYIYYLPLDLKKNARKFIKLVNPKVAFFIKYEFWNNYINQLNKKNIPIFLISGIFRKDQVFFKKHGGWYRDILKKFNYLFVQDSDSYNLLRKLNINNVIISGDTRFDRVYKTAKNGNEITDIELFKQKKLTVIAGSTWPADDELFIKYINTSNLDIKYIIAPHEISRSHISYLQSKLIQSVKFSEKTDQSLIDSKVLIIDSIGILSTLYKYGDVAYIGGGFGKGIHNTLEAAAFGLPVIFGPNYKKFREAVTLIDNGSSFSISNYGQFENILTSLLINTEEINKLGRISKNYVIRNKGVTKRILQVVNDYI